METVKVAKTKGRIYMYDLKGEFKRGFASLTEAGQIMDINITLVSRASRGLRESAGGYRWTREEFGKLEPLEAPIYEKTFHQYKMTGEYVDSYEGLSDLMTRLKLHIKLKNNIRVGISGCLKGTRKNYKGFQWSSEKVENIGKDLGYLSVYRRVEQRDNNGNVIAVHNSLLDAVRCLGLSDSCKFSLGHVIRGEAKVDTYKGFRWGYVNEERLA